MSKSERIAFIQRKPFSELLDLLSIFVVRPRTNKEIMSLKIEDILTAIKNINERKAANYVVKPKNASTSTPNLPIGIDSLAYELKVKIDMIEPIIEEMISFNILEVVHQKVHVHSKRVGWKQIKLTE